MPSVRRKAEPFLYPPLTPELKVRMRKAGHGDMVELLDDISASTIKGLMKAARCGPVFKPRANTAGLQRLIERHSLGKRWITYERRYA